MNNLSDNNLNLENLHKNLNSLVNLNRAYVESLKNAGDNLESLAAEYRKSLNKEVELREKLNLLEKN